MMKIIRKLTLIFIIQKSEIDFSKITDKNYIDSIIDVYSYDAKSNENENVHSVVFMK